MIVRRQPAAILIEEFRQWPRARFVSEAEIRRTYNPR